MPATRREFLAVAGSGLLAAACAPRLGSNSGPQTIATSSDALPPDQILEPELRLILPAHAVAPSTFTSFVRQTGVHLHVTPSPGDSQLQLDLAAGLQGEVDLILVEPSTVAAQVALGQLEALDRALLPNLRNLEPPFANPPYDPGGRHSVGYDYTTIGISLAAGVQLDPAATWKGLFTLAQQLPGQVAVPDDAATVLGAALVATGHSWNSDSNSDLAAAETLLQSLRGTLILNGPLATAQLGTATAAIVTSLTATGPAGSSGRYVVPLDGTVAAMRSFCIPLLAPDPVAAHAWLNHVLDPIAAAADVTESRRGTPLRGASYLVNPALLQDQTIFPPPQAMATLTLSTVSDPGMVAREAIWQAVRA